MTEPLVFPPATIIASEAVDQPHLRQTLHCLKAVLVEPSVDGAEPRTVWPDELIERIAQRVVEKLDGRLLEKV